MSTEKEPEFQDPLGPKGLNHAFEHIGRLATNHKAALEVLTGKKNLSKHGDEEFPPTKFCPICRVMHSPSGIRGDTSLSSKVCTDCQIQLDGGAIAVHSPDRRYAFLHSEKLVGVPQILEVDNATMDKIKERAAEIKERDERNGWA